MKKTSYPLLLTVLMAFTLGLKWFVARHFGYLEFGMEGLILEIFLLPVVYFIGVSITNMESAGLFAALLAATIPVYNWKAGAGVANTLTAALFLIVIALLINIDDVAWVFGLLIVVLFAASSFYAMFLLPIFLIYFLLSKFEGASLTKVEKSFMVWSSVLVVLVFVFLIYSPNISLLFKQYLETQYWSVGAGQLTLENILSRAGSLAILYGLLGMYVGFKDKIKPVFLLSSVLVVFTLLMLLNIFELGYGLAYFTLTSACLASAWYANMNKTIGFTRFKKYHVGVKILMVIFIVVYGALTYLSAVR